MFRNDYSEIAAPCVLQALAAAANEQNVGYGLDSHSARAASLILKRFGLTEKEADVHFLAGGTQTNMTVISFFLRPFEAVIACDSGHINVHETGAVEASGHKVLTVPAVDGKLTPEGIDAVVHRHTDEHMVAPRMVYISQSTETGTVYTDAELCAIRSACDKHNLVLFIDGARLGVALTCGVAVTAENLARVADVFYVGGTKNGAMAGEAVVLKKAPGTDAFRYHIKNRGAMTAKGFVTGIQFEALFTSDTYFALARNSNDTAKIIREELTAGGIELTSTSPTNQIFIRVPASCAEALMQAYGLEFWADEGKNAVLRIVTSFATRTDDCRQMAEALIKTVRECQ